MVSKCEYPSCKEPLVSYLHRGGKVVGLCDLHLDHVLSENRKLVMATEKTLKIPPMETGSRMARPEEEDIYCCAKDCPRSAALFYGNKPVCHEHAKTHEYIPFDGVYRKRKIIVIERPKAAPNAVVMKGTGTGDEKREKKRKIYPVNPTRGIPLPAKEGIPVENERQQRAEEREMLDNIEPSPEPEEQDMVEAEKSYSKPTKTAHTKLGKYQNNRTTELIDKANRDLEDQALESFTEAVQAAPEDDIHAILARLNSGELEMPED